MNSILLRFYLYGYQKRILPRLFRRIFARTEIHNAWHCGFHGRFEQDGVSYGPTNPYGSSHTDGAFGTNAHTAVNVQ